MKNGLDLNSLQNKGETSKKPKKRRVSTLGVVLTALFLVLALVVVIVYSMFKGYAEKQREMVLVAKSEIETNMDNYNSSILPLLLECVAVTKSRDVQYDDVLKAKQSYESSDDKISSYKNLKSAVDAFIVYTNENKDLVELKSYKEKLDVIVFYDNAVNTSLDNYNKQVNNYREFMRDIKYKFIGNANEFLPVE